MNSYSRPEKQILKRRRRNDASECSRYDENEKFPARLSIIQGSIQFDGGEVKNARGMWKVPGIHSPNPYAVLMQPLP